MRSPGAAGLISAPSSVREAFSTTGSSNGPLISYSMRNMFESWSLRTHCVRKVPMPTAGLMIESASAGPPALMAGRMMASSSSVSLTRLMLPPTITVADEPRTEAFGMLRTPFFTVPATWAESNAKPLPSTSLKSSVSLRRRCCIDSRLSRRPAPGSICRNSPRFISLEKEPLSVERSGR